ncbi:MAG TPA: hypothetical protein VE155_03480 [Pseudonocardiaceae bacterium]|nr:hypothetical protein [Pseudonocardiaceae bacterium]
MPTGDTAPIGAPCWIDLMTSDTERSRAFYCELFGWTAEQPAEVFGWDTQVVSDAPEFCYTTLRQGDAWLAGIMDASGFLPEGVPAQWSVYFGSKTPTPRW